MGHRGLVSTGAATVVVFALCVPSVHGQISYGTSGVEISENFDSLPTDKANNGSVGTSPAGWIDDTTSPGANQFSIPGWYLRHPTDLGATGEGGANQRQRMRLGSGQNTGAFWGYATNSSTAEKALGSLGATTIAGDGAEMYMALRLRNDTGSTLTSFTLTYDGEQWRDGQSASAETLTFGYNLGATTGNWFNPATVFTAVPTLNFTAPVISGTNSAGTPVDGNTAGLVANISSTVFGINWLPGEDLWLRWADPQLASNADDGLAIDNVRFIAPGTGPSPDVNSAMSGNASSPATWQNNQSPMTGFTYHVLLGHTVTVDGPFTGSVLRAESGGTVNIGPSGNGQHIPFLQVAAGGALTESVSGDFSLGDITSPAAGILELNQSVSFNIDPGPASLTCDLCLNMKITGAGNIDINSAPGTSASIPKASAHTGTIRFNGTGDVVKVDGNEAVARLEMNSTGMNKVQFLTADVANLTFNQPGSVDHLTTTANRLQGPNGFVVNAAVTVNLTTGYPDNTTQTEERRFQIGSLSGSGNITVNGTPTNYTPGPSPTFPVTLNEFELGTTPQPAGNLTNSTYSGTITANDYVNLEMRHNMTRAGFVVNNHARLEFGHQIAHADQSKLLSVGQITVNNGGTLEIGFEQGPVLGSPFYDQTGHHAYHLNVTSIGGRSGGLTMTSGATIRMQINGTAADQFDSLSATGNIALGGATLDLLINPQATDAMDVNDAWSPAVGDKFNILTIAPAPVPGDYNRNGSVDNEDHGVWQAAFGNTAGFQAADGNNNGVVDAADYVMWRENLGKSSSITGSISGTFGNINVLDPNGWLDGLTFKVNYSATAVQLEVIAPAGSGSAFGAAVPEPSTLALAGLVLAFGLAHRRGRHC